MSEAHCFYCSNRLTDPLSIERGVGPDCWADYGAADLSMAHLDKATRVVVALGEPPHPSTDAEREGILSVLAGLGGRPLSVLNHSLPDPCKGHVQTQRGRFTCENRTDYRRVGALCGGPCVVDPLRIDPLTRPRSRDAVWARTRGLCHLCLGVVDDEVRSLAWHTEHVVSKNNGGPDVLANLAPAHPYCNWKKATDNASGLSSILMTALAVTRDLEKASKK